MLGALRQPHERVQSYFRLFSLLMLIGVAGTAGYAVRLQTEDDVEDAVLVAELDDTP